MLTAIISLFTSSGMGAITGLVGSWLTKTEERKANKQKYDYDLKMEELRLSETKLEQEHALAMADKNIAETEIKGQVLLESAEISAFQESLKAQTIPSKNAIVGLIRDLMRPVITTYLLGIATYLIIEIAVLSGGLSNLPVAELSKLFQDILVKIMFLVTTTIAWWFGSCPSRTRTR